MTQDRQTMAGKVCVVTGATAGLGRVTAEQLAALGADVVVVGRNADKCRTTTEAIKRTTGNDDVSWMRADLSSRRETAALAEQIKAEKPALHVLVNNAGLVSSKRELSVDGVELTFATNYLAPFLLTNLLVDVLEASAPARVVNVGSVSHSDGEIDFDDLGYEKGYRPFKAYSRSKLALLLFNDELARRLAGTGVTVNTANPGLVSTKLGQDGLVGRLWLSFVHRRYRDQLVTPEEGAKTIVYLASSPDVETVTGKYFTDEQQTPPAPRARDKALATRLWAVSEDLVDLRPSQA